LNQIVCALRFFYGVTLGQDTVPERITYAGEPSKLPVVLSADEVVRFLETIPSLKSRTALTTVYAAGLRVSEVVLLKIADINSRRMVIRVEQGKGGKDRYVMLSPQLLRILRTYWRLARPKRWLFPGHEDERPLVAHAACRSACAAAGLSKQVTVHILRHTFAYVKPDRERVRHGAASNREDKGSPVGEDRQAHGVQTGQRRCENVATIEGEKSVAQSRRRRQIPKRHRGHQNAGSPRRLIDLVTQSPA
jgi:integrase